MPVIYGEDGECLKQILQVNPLHLTIYDVNFVAFISGCYSDDFGANNLNSCPNQSYIHMTIPPPILLHIWLFTTEHTKGTSTL